MKIINTSVFLGRNIYSHKKCIRLDVDLEGYCETPSNKIENFTDRLVEILPELRKHRCGIDEDEGFIKRLREGTYLGHICEHIILALQNMTGIEVSYGKTREISGDNYYIIFQYEHKNTALEAANIAVDMINALINKKVFNFEQRFEELKNILVAEQLGPSTLAIYEEVKKRGIPTLRIGERSMFQLGYGKYGKMIEATVCSSTSTTAVDIACDKLLTKEILYGQSIPVARGGKVQNSLDLLLKAESIGYPIVLKPIDGNQGKGVFVNINNEREALNSYKILTNKYKEIMIEKHIVGMDFRVCIVDGKVVAVSERIPPYVVGDGIKDIETLIKDLNKDERRGNDHEKPLTKVKIDEAIINYIGKKGYKLSSVLEKGERLTVRENANLSTGGMAIDCTDLICEENKEICERAAKAIGLNICGIDVCCKDISKSIINTNGAIIEVNAAPGIRMHHYPSEGKSRNVAGAIVDMITKEGYKDIPLVSITGTNGKTTTTRLIAHTLSVIGHNVGMTTTGGIYINNKCIARGDTTGPNSALTVLFNKEIDAAVLETARGGMVREGLAYNEADVGVITNITDDHLGIDGINTLEELAFVKALVGEAVKKDGYAVLNADDKMSTSIINRMKNRLILFSKDKNNEFLRDNIENGGYGIYINRGYIYVEKEYEIYPVVKVSDIPITLNGSLIYNVENAMAACAALIGLKVPYTMIKEGLKTFKGDETQNPGRFNMYNVNNATVILDYGHNIEGYRAVLQGAKNIKHNRLVGVIGVPGDRLESNIVEIGKISGEQFDYIFIKEDEDKRGEKEGEVAKLLEKGVLSSNFNSNNLEIIYNEREALKKAIDTAMPGDLIIIFFEKYEPLVELVKDRMKNHQENKTVIMA